MIRIDFVVNNSNDINIYRNIFSVFSNYNFDPKLIIKSTDTDSFFFSYKDAISEANRINMGFLSKSRDADIVFTTQGRETVKGYKGIKIRIHYGVALNPKSWSRSSISVLPFDFIMVPCKYDKKKYSRWLTSESLVISGYPKYKKVWDSNWSAQKIKLNSPKKKTLLYLPTWGKKSSFEEYVDALFTLQNDYNVVIKFHHVTTLSEQNRINKAKNLNLFIFEGELEDILFTSDLVMCDVNSGSLAESLMFKKRTVGLVTGSSNLEWINTLSKDHEVPFCFKPNDLERSIEKLFNKKLNRTKVNNFSEMLLSYRTKKVSEIAIYNLLRHIIFTKSNYSRNLINKLWGYFFIIKKKIGFSSDTYNTRIK